MTAIGLDSLQTRSTLTAGGKSVDYFSIAKAAEKLNLHVTTLRRKLLKYRKLCPDAFPDCTGELNERRS